MKAEQNRRYPSSGEMASDAASTEASFSDRVNLATEESSKSAVPKNGTVVC